MKMYLISDNIDTYTGMRLAGVDGVVVHERDELKETLEKAMNKEIGIMLLTEKFGREFPELIDEIKLERKMPLLIMRFLTGTELDGNRILSRHMSMKRLD